MDPPQPQQFRKISVSCRGQTFPLWIPTTATVLDLKTEMSPFLGAPVDKQVVSCSMKHMIDLENNQVLSNAVLNIESVVVKVKLQVWVRLMGSEVRQSVTVFDVVDGRKMKEHLKEDHGFGALVATMKLGVVNPATNEVVVIDEETPFYNIVYPVPIMDGTELLVLI